MKKALIIVITAVALTGTAAMASHCCASHATTTVATNTPPADRQVYGQYLLIQAALAGDSLKGVPEAATAIVKLVRDDAGKKLPAAIADAADKVGKASEIKDARSAFKELSNALIAHRKGDKALAEQFYVVHCPMAFDNQGADWLQATKTVSNPYYGASMLRCGAIQN